MNEIIKINGEDMTMSARELHQQLKIGTAFKDWMPRMIEYGFTEGRDFKVLKIERVQIEGCREVKREVTDYELTVEMAKEICMIQRTPEGRKVRQYLIDLEKAWNTPEAVMARALKMADQALEVKREQIRVLTDKVERMKPKEVFADAVSASDTSILIRDLAKIINQNGRDMGEKRLYKWMREHGYIIKHDTMPTQKAMEMGLFEIVERTIQRADQPPLVTATARVTGKGQQYFINKLL